MPSKASTIELKDKDSNKDNHGGGVPQEVEEDDDDEGIVKGEAVGVAPC